MPSPDILLGWLPAPVLVALLYIFIKREFARNDQRWIKIEAFLDTVHKLATKDELDKAKVEFAAALTNMGNRFFEQLEKERNERVRLEKELAVTNNELKNSLMRVAALEGALLRK